MVRLATTRPAIQSNHCNNYRLNVLNMKGVLLVNTLVNWLIIIAATQLSRKFINKINVVLAQNSNAFDCACAMECQNRALPHAPNSALCSQFIYFKYITLNSYLPRKFCCGCTVLGTRCEWVNLVSPSSSSSPRLEGSGRLLIHGPVVHSPPPTTDSGTYGGP